VTFRSYRNIQRTTRISVCVTAVSKSHEFFVESSLTFLFFSTTTPTPSHQRVIIFSTTTQGIRLNVDSMFFNDVGHYGVSICGGDVISIFPPTRTCPELYRETSLFVKRHFPSNGTLSNMSSHQICPSPRRVSVRCRSC